MADSNGMASRAAAFSGAGAGMDVRRARPAGRVPLRWILAVAGLLMAGGVTALLAGMKNAAPAVERASVWTGTVQRGPLVREVRGVGSLVPEEIRWLAARTDARVERIAVYPGAAVSADTVLMVLSNPELEQSAAEADGAIRSADARLLNLRAQLEGQALERESGYAKMQGERDTAAAQVEVNERLSGKGLIAPVELKKSQIAAKELTVCCEIESKRVDFARRSIEPQLAVARNEVDQAQAQATLKRAQLDALQVRAGMNGILQQNAVEVGQRVTAGATLARVADPRRLKAQVKIPETQARDMQPGLPVSVDTRNGTVEGRISRVDPAVQNGTVLIDVTFHGAELPRGARPDLTVDGNVQLERVDDCLFVNRPTAAREESAGGVYRLTAGGAEAQRVAVQYGRGSAATIEVRSGLQAGDEIIVSDTAQFEAHGRIRLR